MIAANLINRKYKYIAISC